jgi:hypothetical protein
LLVGLSIQREVVKDGWIDKYLIIIVEKPFTGETRNSKTELEDHITQLIEIFKTASVLERSRIRVSGVAADMFASRVDLYSRRLPLPEASKGAPPGPNVFEIERAAYFDHDGLIWKLSMIAPEEETEKAKIEFEHVIKTFKILD